MHQCRNHLGSNSGGSRLLSRRSLRAGEIDASFSLQVLESLDKSQEHSSAPSNNFLTLIMQMDLDPQQILVGQGCG